MELTMESPDEVKLTETSGMRSNAWWAGRRLVLLCVGLDQSSRV